MRFGKAKSVIQTPVAGGRHEWAEKLSGIGRALDHSEHDLREVAFMTSGEECWISALAWANSRFHASWGPTTLRVVHGKLYSASGESLPERENQGSEGAGPSYEARMFAIGSFTDHLTLRVLDVNCVPTRGGVVLNCFGSKDFADSGFPQLFSREVSDIEIDEFLLAHFGHGFTPAFDRGAS
jgi:hypothetical protein